MAQERLSRTVLWAKASKGGGAPFHPLVCHLIDVAAVARCFWDSVFHESIRRALAATLGLECEHAARWMAFWAGAHDLGKASPGFQARAPALRKQLENGGFHFPRLRGRTPSPHNVVTTHALVQLLAVGQETGTPGGGGPTCFATIPEALARRVASAVGGHHGTFPRSHEVSALPPSVLGVGRWQEARHRLLCDLARALGLCGVKAPRVELGDEHAFFMMLAGLTSVADWVASCEAFFGYADPDIDVEHYGRRADEQARIALAKLAWTGWSLSGGERTFATLFPETPKPRPLQQLVVACSEETTQPSLAIIEAPTGEGKTEAALYLAQHWYRKFGQQGCYVALPTQATSNQMFQRVRKFLERLAVSDDARINLTLLHGKALLSETFQSMLSPSGVYDDSETHDHADPGVVAAEWFVKHKKRGLLAPFGVGTIDQALLAVLQTRHVFVRLFGLAHKTVVIDEAHAYDTYMTTLLERLVEWLAALDCSIVVLSATLPKARTQALLRAYAAGRPRAARTIGIGWVDGRLAPEGRDNFGLGSRLYHALRDGGCAAVICNTVWRAQEVYQALKRYFPAADAGDGYPELGLLHSQYLFEDRDRREKRALVRFGKPGGEVDLGAGKIRKVNRPARAVLVATQVIEQSLDLDFDLVVTDMAPIDLLLQRAGRLHRHNRDHRPANLVEPTLWICEPEHVTDGVPQFDRGTSAIYDAHILLRSWLTLRNRTGHAEAGTITVPDDVEALIEEVYDEQRRCPSDEPPTVEQVWEDTRRTMLRSKELDERSAKDLRILPPWYEDDVLEDFNRQLEEDDPTRHPSIQALTRLGDLTASVICLDGREAADIEGMLPRSLLEKSATISDKRVVRWIIEHGECPTAWSRSPLLRHHRLVKLTRGVSEALGSHRLRIDPELGIRIEPLSEGG